MSKNNLTTEKSMDEKIEEKYTKYLDCETDTLELTIDEAIYILENDEEKNYVSDLLQEVYKIILSDYKKALKEAKKYKNMYEAEHEIHLVRNEQLDRKENAVTKCNKLIIENAKLKEENEELKYIRYDTPYGTETIHLIPESNLIEINTHKYMIEVEPGKFVDLKQVYLENKKLNEYKENYIPIQEIKDIIEELNRKIDKSIDNSKGGLDEEFIEKAGELLIQKRILLELLRRKK